MQKKTVKIFLIALIGVFIIALVYPPAVNSMNFMTVNWLLEAILLICIIGLFYLHSKAQPAV